MAPDPDLRWNPAGRRFVFLSYLDVNLYRFRLPVMSRLVALGGRVVAVAPPSMGANPFAAHGIEFVPVRMRGAGIDPVQDARLLARLERLVGTWRPDVLQTFMLKPNLLGGWIARRVRNVQVISTVTGLGSLYEDGGGASRRALRRAAEQLMRRAFSEVTAVVFQNPDDRAELVSRGVCDDERARLIPSSGVDVDEFSQRAVDRARVAELRQRWGIREEERVVTLVARLLPSKGVREFAEAAHALRGRARFVLIGPTDATGSRVRGETVPEAEIERWRRSSGVIAPGLQFDIREWLAMSDVYALPSYYREGVPRSVLEAMAMALPVVTTDMPGCRETVADGENGYLVPPRDADALIEAVGRLLDDARLRRRMGERSRAFVEEKFSSETVVAQHLSLYREVLDQAAPV